MITWPELAKIHLQVEEQTTNQHDGAYDIGHQHRQYQQSGVRIRSPSRLFGGVEEKDTFWRQMDQELRAISEGERVIVGGYLNGHVGINRDAIERIHGGWGVKERGPR